MPTETEVIDALRPVEDPEIRQSIVDLDMVRGIVVKGDQVGVTVALTVAGCPLKAEITKRVTEAVSALAGVGHVDVDLTVMTDEERHALAQRLNGGGGHAHSHEHGDGAPSQSRPNPFIDSKTRVLAIASGKGGVGKSSVTTNLAVALAQRGTDVAAIDADVWGFSMPRMLGIDGRPRCIDDVDRSARGQRRHAHLDGLLRAARTSPSMWRGPMLHKALEQFLTDVHWGEPDYLSSTCRPAPATSSLSMAQFLPRAEVVDRHDAAARRAEGRAARRRTWRER